jgi:hypothetical protein
MLAERDDGDASDFMTEEKAGYARAFARILLGGV